jgi:hypothetical protein
LDLLLVSKSHSSDLTKVQQALGQSWLVLKHESAQNFEKEFSLDELEKVV